MELDNQRSALGTAKGILDVTDDRLNALNTLMDTLLTSSEY